MAKSIMIQGAGSNVGKSILVAGLARAFSRRGLKVAPFKPQNMSNNAAVAADGGEIGRAQALQARACNLAPSVHMNPILLKPETDTGAQVVVQGQRFTTSKAKEYGALKPQLLPHVLDSFQKIAQGADLVLIEGAGSPAEVNLRAGDIANMGFAEAADIPVVIIGDIDRGGVIAQLVGTHTVLDAGDKSRIKAFVINKFRGDVSLFDEGAKAIAAATDWRNLGVLPWFPHAHLLPAEDVMDIKSSSKGQGVKIAVPQLSRIANFDDLDPLSAMPDVSVEIVRAGKALPGDADLVLIPGSKSTIGDLGYFRAQGWDVDLAAHIRRGGAVLGICGGYQMLGKEIIDEAGIEGQKGAFEGLGYLDVVTHMTPDKTVTEVSGKSLPLGHDLHGYEIHIGRTDGPDCQNPWLEIDGAAHGASTPDGRIRGCYIHGLFSADQFRSSFLESLGASPREINYDASVEATLDALADHIEAHLDLDLLYLLAEAV